MQLLRVENTKKSLSGEGDTRSVALRPRTTALCTLAFQIRGKSHAQPVSESDLGILFVGLVLTVRSCNLVGPSLGLGQGR